MTHRPSPIAPWTASARTVAPWTMTVLLALLASAPGTAGAQADPPEVVLDDSVGLWKVDRFVGNTKAGAVFYQGAAREVGGLQRPGSVVETPEGIYLASQGEGLDQGWALLVLAALLVARGRPRRVTLAARPSARRRGRRCWFVLLALVSTGCGDSGGSAADTGRGGFDVSPHDTAAADLGDGSVDLGDSTADLGHSAPDTTCACALPCPCTVDDVGCATRVCSQAWCQATASAIAQASHDANVCTRDADCAVRGELCDEGGTYRAVSLVGDYTEAQRLAASYAQGACSTSGGTESCDWFGCHPIARCEASRCTLETPTVCADAWP